MKKWLDKYEAPKAQNGIEGTMGGLTDKGFNYNGAWGGQFQMGGSIPGSVGFTYARTNSPAPSEGPYAKKTMPSAQNGTVEDIANSSREDMLKFYAERPQDLQIPEIEESLKKIKVKGKSPMFMDIFQGGALGYYNPIGNVIGYNTDPNITDLEGGVEETLKHEFGHKAFSKLPKEMRQIVKESILPSEEVAEGLGVKKKFARYVTTPTEFYTRRRSAIEGLGIDPSKKISQEEAEKLVDFTNAVNSIYTGKPNPKENYNKFKEAYPEKVEMLEKLRAYPGSEEAFQFIKSIKNTPETYMQMFNDVTAVPGETVPMAENGREMSYYQHGLDWKPKTISKNGGWLDKYIPEAQDGVVTLRKDAETLDKLAQRKAFEKNITNQPQIKQGKKEISKTNNSDGRSFWETASQFIPVYEQFLDVKDIVQGAFTGDTEMRNRGIVGMAAPVSGKAVMGTLDYLTEKTLGKETADYNEDKRKNIINKGPAFNEALFKKYGWGGYDKWVADGKPPLYKEGGIIKDDRGQWAHPGEITEIDSNQITMKGVPYPVLGVSDTGDTQMMYPGQEYAYDGSSVTEFPMMQNGGLTKSQTKKVNQKAPQSWLDQYK